LPEGIGESSCRQCATRSTPLGNPPSPPPRLRPQPSYVEVKKKTVRRAHRRRARDLCGSSLVSRTVSSAQRTLPPHPRTTGKGHAPLRPLSADCSWRPASPETSVAPVSSLEPSAPLKGLCHHIPERLGKDTLLYGP
jgi:hypothetical protein